MKITSVIVLSFAVIAVTKACKPVLLVHGFLEPAIRIEPLAQYIRTAPDCPDGRNATVLYVAEGVFSFIPMWEQVKLFQNAMLPYFEENPNGIHVISYSQGTLSARAVIQTTDNHNVHTFVSLGGINMGISGVPIVQTDFLGFNELVEPMNDTIIRHTCYNDVGQNSFSACNYWRDENFYETYIKESIFLPIIDNEVPHDDAERFKKNLVALKKFIMISTRDDEVVSPWQSGLFGSRAPDNTITKMEDQPIYKSDVLGLKTLNERGDIERITVSGLGHAGISLSLDLCYDYIIPYLD